MGRRQKFDIDGVPLIFSTLRPDPKTNVRLWTVDRSTLDGWIFGIVALVGAALVLTIWRAR